MNVSILIATRGDSQWATLARNRAVPSAERQPALEVIHRHFHYNMSLAGARNALAEEAVGERLLFLDADDELADGYVDAMQHTLDDHYGVGGARTSPVLLVPALQQVDTSGHWIGQAAVPAWHRPLIDVNCACIGTVWPAGLFRDIGGFKEWPIYEDWEIVMRAAVSGARLVAVPRAVYLATVSPQSRNQDQRYAETTYTRIRSEYLPHAEAVNAAKVSA